MRAHVSWLQKVQPKVDAPRPAIFKSNNKSGLFQWIRRLS